MHSIASLSNAINKFSEYLLKILLYLEVNNDYEPLRRTEMRFVKKLLVLRFLIELTYDVAPVLVALSPGVHQ